MMSRDQRPFVLRALARVPGVGKAGQRIRGLQTAVQLGMDTDQARAYRGGRAGKPAWRRVADNVRWWARYGSAFDRYYTYGLETRMQADYAPFHLAEEVARGFSRQIYKDGAEHVAAVLRSKYFFSLVAQALGHRSPRTLALMDPVGVTLLNPRRVLSYGDFVHEASPLDAFAKATSGAHGSGAFALRIDGGCAWVNGEAASPADVAGRVTGRYLLQERIEQHPTLAALHTPSLNTVRLVTVLRDGHVEPVTAALRFGTGGSVIDNLSAGGGAIGLDITSGASYGKALVLPAFRGRHGSGLLDRHPDTDVWLDGYKLPYVSEAIELACQFHLDLGGPRSIGWDVAFTPTGPSIVEGNSHWSPRTHAALDPHFAERFAQAVS